MIVQALREHLNKNMGCGKHTPDEGNIKAALSAFEDVLRGVYTPNEPRFPRPSNLGHEARRLWLMKNKPEDEVPLQLGVFTATAGLLWEAMVIYLMKEAGIDIRNVQGLVDGKLGGYKLRGSIDFEVHSHGIDGGIVDMKTCSDYAFRNKWTDAFTLIQNDSYGYIEQAAMYEMLSGKLFAGWLVLNKGGQDTNGDITQMLRYVDATPIKEHIERTKQKLEANLKATKKKKMPEQCYPLQQEIYTPKSANSPQANWAREQGWTEYEEGKFLTGNIKLDNRCANCPHVEKTCFPNAHKATNRYATTFYINKPKTLKAGYSLVEDDNEK